MSMVEHGVQEAGTGNALFSPVSILTTLNMLLLGTQGDTRTELLTALGNTPRPRHQADPPCPGYPRYTADVHAQFQAIIRSMNTDIGVTVATSNALFHQVQCGDRKRAGSHYNVVSVQVNFPIKQSFREELRRSYGSEVAIVPVDFTHRPRTTVRRING